MTALTEADAAAFLRALYAEALEQMGAGWTGDEIVTCLEDNLAWIEAQR